MDIIYLFSRCSVLKVGFVMNAREKLTDMMMIEEALAEFRTNTRTRTREPNVYVYLIYANVKQTRALIG